MGHGAGKPKEDRRVGSQCLDKVAIAELMTSTSTPCKKSAFIPGMSSQELKKTSALSPLGNFGKF